MRTDTIPASSSASRPARRTMASRPAWRTMLVALVMLTGALSLAGVAMPATAHAATTVVDQCNGHGPQAEGATTGMKCTVTVVNTINGTTTSSTTTVTLLCTLGPCSTPNGTFTTRSDNLVTKVQQCNNSDNDAAHAISCDVTVTNYISSDTPDAKPLTKATSNQCVGSAATAKPRCDPFPAAADAATVTQCNGSANGGGGTVRCAVNPGSTVSRAIPIRVNQCNGTGNPGGSVVSCKAGIITRITATAAAPTATKTRAAKATPSVSSPAPSGALPASTDSTSGPGMDGPLMLGAGLVLAGSVGALLYRRFAPTNWPFIHRD